VHGEGYLEIDGMDRDMPCEYRVIDWVECVTVRFEVLGRLLYDLGSMCVDCLVPCYPVGGERFQTSLGGLGVTRAGERPRFARSAVTDDLHGWGRAKSR